MLLAMIDPFHLEAYGVTTVNYNRDIEIFPVLEAMLDLDFDALAASTDDAALKKLDAYFAGVKPTSKNEYTGLFEGYNLITICAESFSPYLIDKERTPALYALSHSGFLFENYYGTFGSNTTNGEYAYCMPAKPQRIRRTF